MSSRSRCCPWPCFALGVLAVLSSSACQRTEREVVTEVAALTPLPAPVTASTEPAVAPPASSPCPEVEQQARELGATLPKQLDADTRATRVSARGCDLTVEYELVTLSAKDVAQGGMRAMRGEVLDRLCSDKGALAVMQRGGRFTNVYYDRVHDPIGQVTVAADDCGI